MIKLSKILSTTTGEVRPRSSAVAVEEPKVQRAPDIREAPVEQARIDPSSRVVLFTDPSSIGADRFRLLRMRLRELKDLSKLRTIIVTSPLPEDGKTTIAINLATTLAEKGTRSVLLVEADLYHPSVTQRLALPKRPGLAECLEDGVAPLSVIRRIAPLNWYLLQAGQPRGNPAEVLQSESLPLITQRLFSHFDWVVIDSPPVTPVSDALSLTRHADGSLLVIRADRTPSEAVRDAIALIGPKHVLGIVFNGAEKLNQLYSYYGYANYYYGRKS